MSAVGNKVPLRETILAVLRTMPSEAAPEHLAAMIERQVWAWQALNERRVGTARQGWRARLANVERLLSDADHYALGDMRRASRLRADALAEVRSMIDNEEK